MNIPADLKYTEKHEWLRVLGDGTATVGITDYAQQTLGDVTFVELPKVGAHLAAGQPFGVVESVKAASDLYSPAAGEVLAVNEELKQAPESVNRDPYGAAWMIRLKMADPSAAAGLLEPGAYRELTGG